MDANELVVGNKYRIKDGVPLKVCAGPMTYTGTETFRGVTNHVFWDATMRLAHWIDPEKIEPA